jgi:hypothetical protein
MPPRIESSQDVSDTSSAFLSTDSQFRSLPHGVDPRNYLQASFFSALSRELLASCPSFQASRMSPEISSFQTDAIVSFLIQNASFSGIGLGHAFALWYEAISLRFPQEKELFAVYKDSLDSIFSDIAHHLSFTSSEDFFRFLLQSFFEHAALNPVFRFSTAVSAGVQNVLRH